MIKTANNNSYSAIIWWRFQQNRAARWSLKILYLLCFLALFGDFLANEKPIYCKIENRHYFPVFHQYAVGLGWSGWDAKFVTTSWNEQPYQSVIFPPIPYSATTQDIKSRGLVSPFAKQNVPSNRWRHWLGTDRLGRDVAAGIIAGARVALLVGLISMSIASLLGIFLGALAGYFADDRYKISWIRLVLYAIAGGVFFFYGVIVPTQSTDLSATIQWKLAGICGGSFIAAWALAVVLERLPFFSKPVKIPFDLLIMRASEVVESIPGLLLLLAVAAIIEKPSILWVMVVIGLIRWTNIAQFLRAELLKIRQLEYIEAARAMGFGSWRIILRHALPNAVSPLLIVISFGIAAAILLEAFMSFLGIGVAAEAVTWGSMLSDARENFSAWWLAVFPGLAIFFTVTIFNLIGDGLSEAMDVRN